MEEVATLKDIDEPSISKFIADSKEKGRMPETKGLSAFQILEKLQLTEGRKLKRAAIVLFGKDPNRFYPNVQVKIGRFGKDSTDLKFHEIVEGNLVQMLDEVQAQLNHKFLTRPVDFVGMQRLKKMNILWLPSAKCYLTLWCTELTWEQIFKCVFMMTNFRFGMKEACHLG